MTIFYGAPSVFWTLTPTPDCSIACAYWTGQPLPNGRPANLSECGERNMPISAEVSRIVMANTMVQAHYYKVCCLILIDILFGWDTIARKPKSRRGIFGYVEAFVHALEQQGRLFVHHYGVAWIAGLPKTQTDWDRLLQSDELRTRFERYCASIFSSELPVYNTLDRIVCPRPTCDGDLAPLPSHKKFKHLLKPSAPAPLAAKCASCESEFSEVEVVSAIVEKQWSALSETDRAASSTAANKATRHRLGGLSAHSATAAGQLARLLLIDQVHAYAHSRSCIKGRSSTKCRYNFNRDCVQTTGFNKDSEIEYRRRIGNQWLNTFIRIWRRVFHFNMDAHVLWSGHVWNVHALGRLVHVHGYGSTPLSHTACSTLGYESKRSIRSGMRLPERIEG
jgi:hypothetical protein